jgi:hypothetical protein
MRGRIALIFGDYRDYTRLRCYTYVRPSWRCRGFYRYTSCENVADRRVGS